MHQYLFISGFGEVAGIDIFLQEGETPSSFQIILDNSALE
jgi:hypothetical protein